MKNTFVKGKWLMTYQRYKTKHHEPIIRYIVLNNILKAIFMYVIIFSKLYVT